MSHISILFILTINLFLFTPVSYSKSCIDYYRKPFILGQFVWGVTPANTLHSILLLEKDARDLTRWLRSETLTAFDPYPNEFLAKVYKNYAPIVPFPLKKIVRDIDNDLPKEKIVISAVMNNGNIVGHIRLFDTSRYSLTAIKSSFLSPAELIFKKRGLKIKSFAIERRNNFQSVQFEVGKYWIDPTLSKSDRKIVKTALLKSIQEMIERFPNSVFFAHAANQKFADKYVQEHGFDINEVILTPTGPEYILRVDGKRYYDFISDDLNR